MRAGEDFTAGERLCDCFGHTLSSSSGEAPATRVSPEDYILRTSIISRIALLAGAAVALPQLLACLSHPVKEVEYDKAQEAKKGVSIAISKDVDIVFVIDDSGSMAEEQALLSENFEAFINVLEADDVKANYRLAITTTDAGNPQCSKASTTPLNGKFELSSCLGRVALGDFTFDGVDPPVDAAPSCTDFCDLDDTQLVITPTTTEKDDTPAARPWLQNIEGETNLPEGISTVDAFQCFGPQGVAGCGFESHLESMWKALRGADTSGEKNFGFLREQAILSVVFVTDEADCSYNEAFKDVFQTNKVFWNDPADPKPSSAVCWRAGVTCDGDPSGYDTCRSSNKDIDGNAGVPDDQAVLHPISRYTDQLDTIETAKRQFDAGAEVLVAVIGGVPTTYGAGNTDIPYTGLGGDPDTPEQEFFDNFGIDRGCVSAVGGDAVPPVRLREFADHFRVGDDPNIFSICDPDYSPALKAIADKIRDQIKPACMPECIKDTDTTTERLDFDCTLKQENIAAGTSEDIPVCDKSGNTYVPPGDAKVCYIGLVDPTGDVTPDNPDDNLSQECIDDGWNLEFKVFRDGPAPVGTTVSAVCQLSDLPEIECPGLGG